MNNKFLSITANNTVWVLNRIASFIRKRNYNISEMNLTFDNEWFANFLIRFDTTWTHIEQIANQILKLYDVKNVEIIDDLRRIKKVFYVYLKDKENFKNLSIYPDKVVEIPDNFVWIYILDYDKWNIFSQELKEKWVRFYEKSI